MFQLIGTFENYAQFMAHPSRARSGERDYGVWWHRRGQEFPHWRLTWIQNTGELYAVQLTGLHSDPKCICVVVAIRIRWDNVERLLEGWSERGWDGWVLEDWFPKIPWNNAP